MLDEYAGQAGTFITDPVTGTRRPLEDVGAALAANSAAKAAPTTDATQTPELALGKPEPAAEPALTTEEQSNGLS